MARSSFKKKLFGFEILEDGLEGEMSFCIHIVDCIRTS